MSFWNNKITSTSLDLVKYNNLSSVDTYDIIYVESTNIVVNASIVGLLIYFALSKFFNQ